MCLLLGLCTFPYIDLSMAVSGQTWGNLTFTMLEKALDWATTSTSLWTVLAWLMQTTLLSSTKFFFQWPVRYSFREESADVCFVLKLLLMLFCSLSKYCICVCILVCFLLCDTTSWQLGAEIFHSSFWVCQRTVAELNVFFCYISSTNLFVGDKIKIVDAIKLWYSLM